MNKQLIKALRTAEIIQKPIKAKIGRYIYLDSSNRFIAHSPLCTFIFNNSLDNLKPGHWNIKELLAVLKHADEPQPGVSHVDRIEAISPSILDMPVELQLTSDLAKLATLMTAINTISVVFKDKEKPDVRRLLLSGNSVFCFNRCIALEYAHDLDLNIDQFGLNSTQVSILKKFRNPTGLSFSDACLEFGFDNNILQFHKPTFVSNNDISIDKIIDVITSKNNYPLSLSDYAIKNIDKECDFVIAKEKEVIDIKNHFLTFKPAPRPFSAKRLKLVLSFLRNINFNDPAVDTINKLYFATGDLRGVLLGMNE